jgi:hypothetical protein
MIKTKKIFILSVALFSCLSFWGHVKAANDTNLHGVTDEEDHPDHVKPIKQVVIFDDGSTETMNFFGNEEIDAVSAEAKKSKSCTRDCSGYTLLCDPCKKKCQCEKSKFGDEPEIGEVVSPE